MKNRIYVSQWYTLQSNLLSTIFIGNYSSKFLSVTQTSQQRLWGKLWNFSPYWRHQPTRTRGLVEETETNLIIMKISANFVKLFSCKTDEMETATSTFISPTTFPQMQFYILKHIQNNVWNYQPSPDATHAQVSNRFDGYIRRPAELYFQPLTLNQAKNIIIKLLLSQLQLFLNIN